MGNTFVSNKPYLGIIPLPNAFDDIAKNDGINRDLEKYKFVLNVLGNESIDLTDITQEVALTLFNSAMTHRNRIVADGGVGINYSKLIKALNFIRTNSINNFVSLSLAFGYKVNTAKQLIKLYSLSGSTFDAIVDTPTRCKANGLDIQTTTTNATTITVQQAFKPKNPLFGISGEFLSTTEAGSITLGTQNTAATSGITAYESIALAALNGISTGTYRNTGNASTSRTMEQDRNYNKKGVALLLSDAFHAYSDAYSKDLMYSYTTAKQDMSNTDSYVSIRLSSSANSGENTKFREAWFISDGNATTAKNLSKHLNY
ncbi:TPA: hypothetical protein JI093_05615 [Acinetobacter baumannii]|nr:hypothetical protein [Acinetobacter baumannii]